MIGEILEQYYFSGGTSFIHKIAVHIITIYFNIFNNVFVIIKLKSMLCSSSIQNHNSEFLKYTWQVPVVSVGQ
jgi:hypothetical protein